MVCFCLRWIPPTCLPLPAHLDVRNCVHEKPVGVWLNTLACPRERTRAERTSCARIDRRGSFSPPIKSTTNVAPDPGTIHFAANYDTRTNVSVESGGTYCYFSSDTTLKHRGPELKLDALSISQSSPLRGDRKIPTLSSLLYINNRPEKGPPLPLHPGPLVLASTMAAASGVAWIRKFGDRRHKVS